MSTTEPMADSGMAGSSGINQLLMASLAAGTRAAALLSSRSIPSLQKRPTTPRCGAGASAPTFSAESRASRNRTCQASPRSFGTMRIEALDGLQSIETSKLYRGCDVMGEAWLDAYHPYGFGAANRETPSLRAALFPA